MQNRASRISKYEIIKFDDVHTKIIKIMIQAGHIIQIQNINNWELWIRKKNELLNLINHQPDID